MQIRESSAEKKAGDEWFDVQTENDEQESLRSDGGSGVDFEDVGVDNRSQRYCLYIFEVGRIKTEANVTMTSPSRR